MTTLLAASPVMRLSAPPRRPRGGWPVVCSILLHAGLLALLLVAAQHERHYMEPAPPAPVAMVFESGGKARPSIANSAPERRHAAASPAPSTEAQPVPPARPAPAVKPVPHPAPTPAVPRSIPPQPVPAKPTPQASAPAVQAPPVAVPPPQAVPTPAKQAPPPALALPPPAPPAPAPRTEPSRTAPGRAPQHEALAFPAPMNFSLGSARPAATRQPQLRRRPPGTLDLSFSSKAGGGEVTQLHPYGDHQDIGSDWEDLLTKWWIEHRYYPEEAARLGEQGEVTLRVVIAHNGHVESVKLEKSSGSPWIDLAALGTLRDANLPPLPKDFTDPKLVMRYHLHYILVH